MKLYTYINANGEAIFDIDTTNLSSLFENGITNSYQNEYPGSEYEVDSMSFMKYFNSIEDTLRADSAYYYLILFGRLTAGDTNVFFKSSSIELIRIVDSLYIDRCENQGDAVGVTIINKCTGVNCPLYSFTYAWKWLIFHGKITGCECINPPQPASRCDHEISQTIRIGFL